MRRPFFIVSVRTLMHQLFKATGEHSKFHPQFIQFALLPIHHVTQLVIGAFQIGDFEFETFEQILIHGSTLSTCSEPNDMLLLLIVRRLTIGSASIFSRQLDIA
jgi:hypothetical protein